MSLILLSLECAISCDGKEMEMYAVQQQGPSALTAYVASEAGKQFKIVVKNNATDFELLLLLYLDGQCVKRKHLRAGKGGEIVGVRTGEVTLRPFKFQEAVLVDPDLEDAPVVPDMGTIELRAFRCQTVGYRPAKHSYSVNLHLGHVSERSKKAGWHHVSTADEIPTYKSPKQCRSTRYLDPRGVQYASIKVFYRPRELLRAQSIIPMHDIGSQEHGGLEANSKKRPRRDELPNTPKKHRASAIRMEAHSASARALEIRELQAKLNVLMAEQESTSAKPEPRSPSPICVGRAAGEVIDLTLED